MKNWDTSTVSGKIPPCAVFSTWGKSTLHAARMAPFETSSPQGPARWWLWPSWDSLRLGWPDSSGSWLPPGNGRRSRQSQTPCGASISTRGRTSSAPSTRRGDVQANALATCRPWLSKSFRAYLRAQVLRAAADAAARGQVGRQGHVKARLGERFSPPWRGWARTSAAWLRRSCPPCYVLKPNHASSWVLFVDLRAISLPGATRSSGGRRAGSPPVTATIGASGNTAPSGQGCCSRNSSTSTATGRPTTTRSTVFTARLV